MKSNALTRQLVVILLVLQASLSALLWFVAPPTGTASTGMIAIIVSADLLAFAMIIHVYRSETDS